MNGAVLLFGEIDEPAIASVGGKGANLARLVSAGAPVPPGLCLTTAAFWRFLDESGISREFVSLAEEACAHPQSPALPSRLERLRARIAQAILPRDINDAIIEALAKFPAEARFAVRSSATSEDLAEASFAGQYDTFLNVRKGDDLIEKIKLCFASYWNERAFLYRASKGIDHFAHGMGVVVQQLVAADSAGVIFTLNPLTGDERELVIEACLGLGEALVSGQVTPDRFVVDPFSLQLKEREIARKALKMISNGDGGVREIELDGDAAHAPSLTDKQALELAALAVEIQRHYGHPIDIEWARAGDRFFILQARPLTAFSFAPELGQWSSANFREVMPGLVNPLSFTLSLEYDYGQALDEFLRTIGLRHDSDEVVWSRRFFGRAYWNVGIVKKYASQIPGYCERAFDETIGIEPDYQGDGTRTTFTLQTLAQALPVFFRLQWVYRFFWREAASYEREFHLRDKKLSRLDCRALSDEELKDKAREMVALHFRTNRIALICSFLATESQNDFRQYIDKLNKRLDAKISTANLLTGLSSLSTAEPLVELWHLANEAKSRPVVAAAIARTDPAEIIEACERSAEGAHFAARLRDYLKRFPYLAANDEDLSCPRWADDATFPLSILKNFVAGEGGENPAHAMARQRKCREEERARALSAVGWARRPLFLAKLQLVTRYCQWREITRVSLSKTYYHCHRVFDELGRRLARHGILENANDIYWLERSELLALLDGRLNDKEARAGIERARIISECYRNFNPPVNIGKGASLPVARAISADGQLFQGVACSAGEVVARARVIRSLSEASRLARGEVLVAPHTNPGWTPLFSLAAAVVLEEGGLLSHGAVVARECGIPTVLQIKGATEIFRDGQLLRVDGSRGEVEVVKE